MQSGIISGSAEFPGAFLVPIFRVKLSTRAERRLRSHAADDDFQRDTPP